MMGGVTDPLRLARCPWCRRVYTVTPAGKFPWHGLAPFGVCLGAEVLVAEREFVDNYGRPLPVVRQLSEAIADVERIEHRVQDEVHGCAAPDCGQRARTAFIVAEAGRLGGGAYEAGDFVDLCPDHAVDIYRAQHAVHRADLAEWLRADARHTPADRAEALIELTEGLD